MWVARNPDGTLELFKNKPIRERFGIKEVKEFWFEEDFFFDSSTITEHFTIDSSLFPDLKWEDEPLEVELLAHINIDTIDTSNLVNTKRPFACTICSNVKCMQPMGKLACEYYEDKV